MFSEAYSNYMQLLTKLYGNTLLEYKCYLQIVYSFETLKYFGYFTTYTEFLRCYVSVWFVLQNSPKIVNDLVAINVKFFDTVVWGLRQFLLSNFEFSAELLRYFPNNNILSIEELVCFKAEVVFGENQDIDLLLRSPVGFTISLSVKQQFINILSLPTNNFFLKKNIRFLNFKKKYIQQLGASKIINKFSGLLIFDNILNLDSWQFIKIISNAVNSEACMLYCRDLSKFKVFNYYNKFKLFNFELELALLSSIDKHLSFVEFFKLFTNKCDLHNYLISSTLLRYLSYCFKFKNNWPIIIFSKFYTDKNFNESFQRFPYLYNNIFFFTFVRLVIQGSSAEKLSNIINYCAKVSCFSSNCFKKTLKKELLYKKKRRINWRFTVEKLVSTVSVNKYQYRFGAKRSYDKNFFKHLQLLLADIKNMYYNQALYDKVLLFKSERRMLFFFTRGISRCFNYYMTAVTDKYTRFCIIQQLLNYDCLFNIFILNTCNWVGGYERLRVDMPRYASTADCIKYMDNFLITAYAEKSLKNKNPVISRDFKHIQELLCFKTADSAITEKNLYKVLRIFKNFTAIVNSIIFYKTSRESLCSTLHMFRPILLFFVVLRHSYYNNKYFELLYECALFKKYFEYNYTTAEHRIKKVNIGPLYSICKSADFNTLSQKQLVKIQTVYKLSPEYINSKLYKLNSITDIDTEIFLIYSLYTIKNYKAIIFLWNLNFLIK